MKLLLLWLPLVGLGAFALGTRVPADTHEVRHTYITRPDPRVAPLLLRVGDLEREVHALGRRPPGLDGPDVRALFETLSGPQVPEETTTTTTEAPE